MSLSIPEPILQTYYSLFIPPSSRSYTRVLDSWYPDSDIKVSYRKLISHFNEECILGRSLPIQTKFNNFFVLDFDYKKEEYKSYSDFKDFVKYCSSLIQAPNIIIQSSESCGIHIYFFIKPEVTEYILDSVEKFFSSKGVIEKAGKFEIYCKSKNLRLPLGKGSYILNESLDRMNACKRDDLNYLVSFIKSVKRTSIFNALPRTFKKQEDYSIYSKIKIEDDILSEGILNFGSTNATLVKVAVYYKSQLGIKDENSLKAMLLSWMDNNNNNRSKTYLNKEKLDKEITNIVEWALQKDISNKKLNTIRLSNDISRFIMEIYPTEFTRQSSLFKLFQGIKLQLKSGKNLISISQSFLLNTCKFNSHNYQFVLEKLQEYQYITLYQYGSPQKGHSNLYQYFGPDLLSSSEGSTSMLDFVKNENLYHCYSKHVAVKLKENI